MRYPLATSPSRGGPAGNAALAALVLAVLSYSLVQTMLVPTVGVLQRDLRTSPAAASWAVLSSTLLTSAVLTPLISRLGDRHGKRRVLVATLTVHLAGTLGAAFAWDVASLIVLRAVQGVSLALLPLALGLIRDVMPPHRVAGALGLTSGLVAGAAGAGLLVGGLLVDHASWRWLFAAGALLVAAALAAVLRWVPEGPTAPSGSLDVPGAALLGGALVAVLLGLTQGPAWGWASPAVLGLFAGCAVLSALFLAWERRVPHPLVDPALLLGPAIRTVHLGAFLLGAVQFVFYVLIPKLAEAPSGPGVPGGYGFGASVTVAGLILVPGTLCGLPASALAGRVEGRFGARAPLALGLAVSAAGGALLALEHHAVRHLVLGYAVIGTGFGFAMAALPRMVHQVSGPDTGATANGVNTVARTVGGAVGSQLAAAILASRTVPHTAVPAAHGYTVSFWTAAGVAAAGALLLLTGRRPGGSGFPTPTAPGRTRRADGARARSEP
ncbi:MFS transporter [Streptomyces mobaraensis NBRC 13819 = DSM 40847]|uniref:MFS transporter n=1 Tax=Streptomyces mobaraensis TaxID=35621 RepID=A0A5N5W977_STRMB|nr:MFS transporter [Streptomyces mobaraensis]QTT77168.1 MFS transporter [Streptomyces mobaraensis NBRC 13819 = DSM 40847]